MSMYVKMPRMKAFRKAHLVYCALRFSSGLIFSKRQKFWSDLRPILDDGAIVAYPDALSFITIDDLERAMKRTIK